MLSSRAGTLYSFLERLHHVAECASENVFHVQFSEQVCTEIPFLEHGIRVRLGTMRASYMSSSRENAQAMKERARYVSETKEHGTCSDVWFGILLIVINKNRVYGFGLHPIVGRFNDRCAEFSRFRAQWQFEEGLASEMNSRTSCVERREGKRRLRQQDRHRTGRAEVLQAGIEEHGVRGSCCGFSKSWTSARRSLP